MGKVVNIKKTGGLGITAASSDGICGIALQVPAPGGASYAIGNVYKLGGVPDLIALGLTEAFCVTGTTNAYQAVFEYFEENPTGILWIQLFAKTDAASVVFDTTSPSTSLLKLVDASAGTVTNVAFAVSPSADPVDAETTLTTTVPLAQAFATFCKNAGKELDVFIEAYGNTGLTNLRTLNSPNVHVVLGQNGSFYAPGTWTKKHTAIGKCLGTVSKAPVNHNIGFVARYNLVGSMQNCLINEVSIDLVTDAQKDTYDTNGYIYMTKHAQYPGIYWNDSFSCTVATDDFSTIEANRTWNKASRLIRAAMSPFINSPVLVNPTTGELDSVTISVMEAEGNKAIRVMFTQEEISGPDPQGSTPPFQIDPKQDVLANSTINTELGIIPTGTARLITNNIGLINPNN